MFLKAHNKTAIISKTTKISYTQLLANIQGYCDSFTQQNYKHVVIFAENRPEWIYSFYAAWKLQAIVIPIDFMSTADDLAYILNDCQPDLIIYSNQTEEVLEQAILLYKVKEKLIFEKINIDSVEIAVDNKTIADYPQFDVLKTAVIIYTSGTTGSPKGVMLSFDNLLVNINSVTKEIQIYSSSDRLMVLLPLHHIFPLLGSMIAPLSVGASLAFCPSMSSEDMMATLQNNAITVVIGVPRLYGLIAKSVITKINANVVARFLYFLAGKLNSKSFSRKVFNSVQQKFGGQVSYLVSGGAKLDEESATILKTLGFEVLEGYGMTEAAPMITFTHPGEVVVGSAGKPMSCNEVKTIDGEIVAKGRNIMLSYYNLPEATAEVIIDGWLHTGDLGFLDKQNNIYITGRKKDIIVLSSGKNISPVEIEHKLMAMTDVIAEVGVYFHENILQVVIFPDFARLHKQNINSFDEYFREQVIEPFNQSVAPYKKLLKVHILAEELPKTRLGKLKRFLLHSLEEVKQTRRQNESAPEYAEYSAISEFLAYQVNKEVYASDHLELDLAMDSLDRVSFQTFLHSSFGVIVNEETLGQYPTVEKISTYIKEKKQHIKISEVEWAEILKEQVDLQLPNSWFLHNPIKNLSRWLLKIYFKLSATGLDNIPQAPFILAANHQSFLDALFIAAFLDNKTNKESYFFAKSKHVKSTLVKFLASQNNIIVVNVDEDLKSSIQQLSVVLKQGKNIIIFPEGTRTKTGELGSFKKTFAILSKELNVPIVPIAIMGAYKAFPTGRFIPKIQQSIQVNFLAPISPSNKQQNSYDDISLEVRNVVANVLKES
ncbi:MAG: AMP-binding protein [Pseudomonadota bacterium]